MLIAQRPVKGMFHQASGHVTLLMNTWPKYSLRWARCPHFCKGYGPLTFLLLVMQQEWYLACENPCSTPRNRPETDSSIIELLCLDYCYITEIYFWSGVTECCMQASIWLSVAFANGSQRRNVHADSEVAVAKSCHRSACDISASWNRQDIYCKAKGHSEAASRNCSWEAIRSNTRCLSAAKCKGRR